MKIDVSETLETGNFLTDEGIYHVVVDDIDEAPLNASRELLQAFKVSFTTLNGTVAGQNGKAGSLMFWLPKLDSKDAGKFARIKITRFLKAIDLLSDDQLGKSVDVDMQQARGRQLVVHLEKNDKYLDLRYADIWHIDDPAVSKIPKDEKSIAALPESQRLIGARQKPAKDQAVYSEPTGADDGPKLDLADL